MKDLGPLHYFLGIEVDCSGDSMHLTQSKYALDLLSRTKFSEAKPISTPTTSVHKLSALDIRQFMHTFDHGLVYRHGDLQLHAFSDVDYA
ncbi:unnamed protein product [Prunus armeniaca]|uniref:Reverse transcriptase Ty1/copia-type domain-containing protein n=1 Tax=Prunus armeniaca TaxID=36596 RepID=A0A6J5TXR3_PRUAR|nr:unnamed protein product [Prunus armeniaca]